MKILFVNDYKEKVGGTEIYLESLSQHLTSLGHESCFFYGSDSYKHSLAMKKQLSSFLNRLFSIRNYLRFRKMVNEIQPDIIHLQNIFNEVSPSILLASKKIPVIMTLHDNLIVQAVFDNTQRGVVCKKEICPGCVRCVGLLGMLYEFMKRSIHNILLKRVSVFIAPSKFVQTVVTENSFFKPIQIYNGFQFPKPLQRRINSRAIFIGRLSDDKGIEKLIDAIPAILLKVKDFTLDIAGVGPAEVKLKNKVKLYNVQEHVSFLGQVKSGEVFDYLNKSTVVVVPSNFPENLPTVCLEALSAGKPIVATKVGGIPEIVSDSQNGYLVESNSSEQLANAIIKLLHDKTKLKLFSENSIKKSKQFDIKNHLEKILDVYSGVIKHAR